MFSIIWSSLMLLLWNTDVCVVEIALYGAEKERECTTTCFFFLHKSKSQAWWPQGNSWLTELHFYLGMETKANKRHGVLQTYSQNGYVRWMWTHKIIVGVLLHKSDLNENDLFVWLSDSFHFFFILQKKKKKWTCVNKSKKKKEKTCIWEAASSPTLSFPNWGHDKDVLIEGRDFHTRMKSCGGILWERLFTCNALWEVVLFGSTESAAVMKQHICMMQEERTALTSD